MAKVIPLSEGSILHGENGREYRIRKHLGHGGYGITYLAEATIMDGNIPQTVKYCIKEHYISDICTRDSSGLVTFAEEDAVVGRMKSDFKTEAKHLIDLNKVPGIVPVNEVFEDNNTAYYVMRHLEGQTLAESVSDGSYFPEAEALNIITSIGVALDKLHSQKMTHLDVKPDNIMLVPDAEGWKIPVLIDFGSSCHYSNRGKNTHDKMTFGVSDGYSPLEQYAGIDKFTPEADVYALAATLFFMLTGRNPRKASDVNAAYLRETLMQNKFVSETTIVAIVNAMKMGSSERTQTVKEFIEQLGRTLLSSGHPTRVIIKESQSKLSPKMIKVGITLVAVLSAIVLIAIFSDSGEKPEPPVVSNHKSDTVAVETNPNTILAPELQSEPQVINTQSVQEVNQNPIKPNPNNPVGQPSSSGSTQPKQIELDYAIWTGPSKNGKPHGYGTMTFKKTHRIDSFDPDSNTAKAGDRIEGTYNNGHLDNGIWHSAEKGDVFLMIGAK